MCQILKKSGESKNLEQILNLLLPSINAKIEQYTIAPRLYNFFHGISFEFKRISFIYKRSF